MKEQENIKQALRLIFVGQFTLTKKIDFGSSDLYHLFGGLVSKQVLLDLVDELIEDGDFRWQGPHLMPTTQIVKPEKGPKEPPSIARMLREFRETITKEKLKSIQSGKDYLMMKDLCKRHGWEVVYEKYDEFRRFIRGRRGSAAKAGLAEFREFFNKGAKRKR